MLEILLEPNGNRLDLKLPVHAALRSVLHRSLGFLEPCGCPDPWLRVFVADTWRFGNLDVTDIHACCEHRKEGAIRALPWATVSPGPLREGGLNLDSLPPGEIGAKEPIRLLLSDCRSSQGEVVPDGIVLASLPKTSGGRGSEVIVTCGHDCVIEDTHVRSLLLRTFYEGPSLEEAIHGYAPTHVVAYWRRYGFDWTPRSIYAAERFGLGVGGSFTAKLTRLLSETQVRTGVSPSFWDRESSGMVSVDEGSQTGT